METSARGECPRRGTGVNQVSDSRAPTAGSRPHGFGALGEGFLNSFYKLFQTCRLALSLYENFFAL